MSTPQQQELERAQQARERANAAGDTDAVNAIDGYISQIQQSIGTVEQEDDDRDPDLFPGVSGPALSPEERKLKIGALEREQLKLDPTASEMKKHGALFGGWGQGLTPEVFESSRRAEQVRQRAAQGGGLNPLSDREQQAMSEIEAFEFDQNLPDADYAAAMKYKPASIDKRAPDGPLMPGDRLVVDPETGETRKAAKSPETLAERRITERKLSDASAQVKTGAQQMVANRLRSEDAEIESRKMTQQIIFEQLSEQEQKRLEEQFEGKEIRDVAPAAFIKAVEANPENTEVLDGISGDESWEIVKERWKRIGNKILGLRAPYPGMAEAANITGAADPHGDVFGIETNLVPEGFYEGKDKDAPLYPGASEHMQEYLNEANSIHFYENVIQPAFKAENKETGREIMPGERLNTYIEKVRQEAYSPEALEKKKKRFVAEDANWYNPFSWADGTTAMPWDDFDAFMIHVFENTPQIAVGIIAARMGGRGAAGLAGRVHAGQRLSRIEMMRRRAAGIGGAASGGGTEGLLIHDAVKEQITQGMNELNNEAFENSPYYLSMIDAGFSDEVARQVLTAETARLGGKTAFVGSGLLMGAPMGYLFGRAAAGRIGGQLQREGALATFGRIGTAGGLEAIQEGSQEVSEDVITNLGMRAVDPDRPIFDDVLNTFMGGALISFVPGAIGGVQRSDPAGLTKEDKTVMDATQDYMDATNRRYSFEASITSPGYIENTAPQQRLNDLKKLEKLQEKEAQQILANQDVMRDHLTKKGGPTAETELMMLDRLVARANATLTDIAVARSRRTTSTQALEQYKREQSERKYIQNQIDDQVLEIHDVARLANNIDKVQQGEALTSPEEYTELVKQGWAKETESGEFIILPKGSRALNHLVQQHESLIKKLEKGYTGVDRRAEGNAELRAQMDAMTEDEFETAIYRREITGLQNRRAMNERLEKDPNAKSFAYADLDSLGWVNDNMGHNAGDKFLMAAGQAFLEEDGKNGIQVYHVSGDEFVISGKTEADVEAAMRRVRDRMAAKPIKAGMDQFNPSLTWATGETVEAADAANNRMAESRKVSGKRAAKGGAPVSHKDIGSTQGVLLQTEKIGKARPLSMLKVRLVSGEQVIYSQQRDDELDIPVLLAQTIGSQHGTLPETKEVNGVTYVDAKWVMRQLNRIRAAFPSGKSGNSVMSTVTINNSVMDEPGAPSTLAADIEQAAKKPAQPADSKMVRRWTGPWVPLQKVNTLFEVVNTIASKYDLYRHPEVMLSKDQGDMFGGEPAQWSDIRREIEIGDEVEIITPENRVVTGTVSMVTRKRGRDRIKVFVEGHEVTFNPFRNWMIEPKNPNALRDISPQAAVNQAMPGSQPNVVPDIMIGRVGRDGQWYADMSAIGTEYQYQGETWQAPRELAPTLPRTTKKKRRTAETVVRALFGKYKNLPRIQLWDSWDDIPDEIQQAIYDEGGTAHSTRGWFDHNDPSRGVHIILPNAINIVERRIKGLTQTEVIERAVAETLFHEIVGHYGIRGLIGNETELRSLMHQLVDSMSGKRRKSMYNLLGLSQMHPQNRPVWKELDENQRRKELQKWDAEKQLVGEEYIAYMVGDNHAKLSEPDPETKGIIKKIIAWVKGWMVRNDYAKYFHNPAKTAVKKAAKNERITDDDVANLIAQAQDFVRYQNEWHWTSLGGDTSSLVSQGLRLMRDGDIFQSGLVTAIEYGKTEQLIWRTEKKDYNVKSKGELKRIKKQVPNGEEISGNLPIFPAEGTIAEYKAAVELAVSEGYVTQNEVKTQRIIAFLDNLSQADLATYLPRSSRDPWWLNQMQPVRESVMTASKIAEWTDQGIDPNTILPEDKQMTIEEAYKLLLSQNEIVWKNQGDDTEHRFGGKDYDDITDGDIEQLKALPSVLRRAYEQAQETVLSDTKIGKRQKVPRELLTAYMNGEKVIRISFKTLSMRTGSMEEAAREVLGEDEFNDIHNDYGFVDIDEWVNDERIDEEAAADIRYAHDESQAKGYDIGYNEQSGEWFDVAPSSAVHTGYMPHYEAAVDGSARNFAIQMYGRGPMYARDTSHSDHLSHHSFGGDLPVNGTTVGHMRTTLMYDADPAPPTAPNPAHQGHVWYLGELQADWQQYVSQAFNSPEEQAAGSSRISTNFITLVTRTKDLSVAFSQKVKMELEAILKVPLTDEQAETAFSQVTSHWSTWDATGEEEFRARLTLAEQEGGEEGRRAELKALLNENPVGKAFALQGKAGAARTVVKQMIRALDGLKDKYLPLNVQSKQYVSDIRLHEALDSAAINKYIWQLHEALNKVSTQLEYADRSDNAAEVADYLNQGLKHLDNWPKNIGDDLIRRSRYSTYQTRIPALMNEVLDVFQTTLDGAQLSNKGLATIEELEGHINKTGSRTIVIESTALDDNGINTAGQHGQDIMEFFNQMSGNVVAAGGNPEVDISPRLDSDGNIVLSISGPIEAVDAATAFVPDLLRYYAKNLYSIKWKDRERERVQRIIQQSEQNAWTPPSDIDWETMKEWAKFEAVDLDNPDSWNDDAKAIIEHHGLRGRAKYIEARVERRVRRDAWQLEEKLDQKGFDEFTTEDGQTLSREHSGYTSKIDTDGNNDRAEQWLRDELANAKARLMMAAKQPGGSVYEQAAKELGKQYDESPAGLFVGLLPAKIGDPAPGFEHGNIEKETPVYFFKKEPGNYWQTWIGRENQVYHQERANLKNVQDQVAYWINEHFEWHGSSSDFPDLYSKGKKDFLRTFPNPFYDTTDVKSEADIPKEQEPNWDEVADGILAQSKTIEGIEEHGESNFLFEESIRLNKKKHRNDWIPDMPMSDEDVRALFLKGILADAVRRGIPRVAWSGGLASTKRGGNWEARWTNVTKITWSREKMKIRGKEKEVLVLQGDATADGNYFGGWSEPLVVDTSAQALGTVLGQKERQAILDQIKGKTQPRQVTTIEPQESDIQISGSGGGAFYLTLSGSNDILHTAATLEDANAKRAELFAAAQAAGGWPNTQQTSGVPTTSVFGGEFLDSGVIHADEFGSTPMRVLVGQSLSQVTASEGYIPTLDITTSDSVDRYWWWERGARFSYDQLTYKAWDNILKRYNSKIEDGVIRTSEYDQPFRLSGQSLGETQVPVTPADLVQQHGRITVEPVSGQRQGYVVTGVDDIVIPQVFANRGEATAAMNDFIKANSGNAVNAARVFQITITDEMRAEFSKPQPFMHYDPYEDPVLKSAAERIGSKLPKFRDRYNEFKKTWKDEAHQGMFDKFYGIKYALKRAELWDELDAENNPYIQARFTTSLDSVMKAVLEFGHPVWKEGITQTEGKGLLEILQPVLNDVESWAMYMAGKRSKGLLLEGVSSLTANEIAQIHAIAKDNFKGNKQERLMSLLAYWAASQDAGSDNKVMADAARSAIDELRGEMKKGHNLSQLDNSNAKLDKIIEGGRERNFRPYEIKKMADLGNHFTQFEKVAKDYAAFNKRVLDYAQEAGIINAETRPLWESADYIPFHRVKDDRLAGGMGKNVGIANQPTPIKRLSGAEDNVGDLMHNIMINLTNLVDASMKNHAARMTIDALKESGIIQKKPMTVEQKMVSMDQIRKKLIERGLNPDSIPDGALYGFQQSFALTPPSGEGVLSIMRDGKKEFYYTDDMLLYRSMSSINMKQFGEWMGLLRGPKRLLTTMVTLDPGFMLANFVRDSASAFVLSRDHFIPVAGAVKGFGQALIKDEAMRTMLSAGAAFESGYINSADPTATHRLLKKAQRKKGFGRTLITSPRTAFEAYRALGSAVENSNRLAVYNAAIAAGKSKAQAAFEAKDLMDFSMGGDWPAIQFLIQTVPFMGARLQGIHRLGRGVHEHPLAFTMKGALIGMAGLALWFAFKDDERYKDLEEWDKDTYFHWWIGEEHYRLPKPFEVGAIFNTIPERFFEAMYSEENDAGKLLLNRFGFMLTETFSMNPIPQAVKPLVESYFNYNTFQERQIVSPYEEQRMAPEQYRSSTNPTWIELARIMPGGVDTISEKIRSPLHLQNLYAGYMGTLGRYFVMASDAIIRNQMGYPEEPDWRKGDYVVMGRFFRGDNPRRTKYEEEVYNLIRKVTKIQGTMRFLDKTEQYSRLDQIEEDWEAYIDIAQDLEGIREDVQDINKEVMYIWQDPKMGGEEKRRRLDDLQREKNVLFKEGWELRPGGQAGAGTRNLGMEDVRFIIDKFGVDDELDEQIREAAPATVRLMEGLDTLSPRELERLASIATNEMRGQE